LGADTRGAAAGGAGGTAAAGRGAGAAAGAGAGAAETSGAGTSGRAATAAPSALTANTVRHTEQRARTPPAGTLAGSIRKTVWQVGQVAFIAQPCVVGMGSWRRSTT
jgi:hypothetical protein